MPSDDFRRVPLTDSVSPEESPFTATALRIDDTSVYDCGCESPGYIRNCCSVLELENYVRR